MTLYLYFPRLHQLAASTRLQVDQTFSVGYILAHVLIWSRIKEINQSDTSVLDAIGERFEDVLPSHGRSQRWDFLSSYLLLRLSFWYWGPPSMATSSLGINGEYLFIQSPIEILILYPLFHIRFLRRLATWPLHWNGCWNMVSCLI